MKVSYTANKIDDNTYIIEQFFASSKCVSYLLAGREKALLIDTVSFFDDGFKPLIDSLTDKPVTVLCTHAHFDHIGSNHLFPEVYLHEDDRKVLALHTDSAYLTKLTRERLPGIVRWRIHKELEHALNTHAPDARYHYIRDGHVFHLGGREPEVIATPGHSAGSICVLERQTRRLYSGDTVCELGILLNLDGSLSIGVYLASVERLTEIAETYDEIWPGHHKCPIDKAYLDEYAACARGILNGSLPPKKQKGGEAATVYKRIGIAYYTKERTL
jgi:glyoxylase-like metal-dependent hydrolase (beta-lactamase superfamily II)